MEPEKTSFIYGIHPLREALETSQRRCHKIVVEKEKQNPQIKAILQICRSREIKVETLPRTVFRKRYGNGSTQGIIGHFSQKELLEIDDLVRLAYQQTPSPVLAMLDGIQDPQNMGAIIRSAEVMGVQGIIIPKHRSVPVNETVAKCSAGAVERMHMASATNLSRTLEELKNKNFWAIGVDMAGDTPCYQFKFDSPIVLVIGGEEKGIRPLIRKTCDFTISIPMQGQLNSLNVSAACAIIFYEIMRQKKTGK